MEFAAINNVHYTIPPITGDVSTNGFLASYLYRDLVMAHLPNLLRYEDRNSMAHSIESRLPFLDYRLVEFAFSLPLEQKICRGITKYILRQAMKGIVPEKVRTRVDKVGFSTPEDQWFRHELRDTILSVIESKSFKKRPYFNYEKVKSLFADNCEGKNNTSTAIWRWVNLELWMRQYCD